jgi:mannan endo-1,4-beta-mannosidase
MRCYFSPILLLGSGVCGASIGSKIPRGFVTREGGVFKLDGKDFYFAGSNAYYFPFNDVRATFPAFGIQLMHFSF